MSKKREHGTRGKIIAAAWRLFYDQGYDNTTIEEIVFESGTSKGSFYHYFEGKEALLGSLAYLFDEKYEQLMAEDDGSMPAIERLLYINRELFAMIENSVSMELLARLLSSQLIIRGEKHLLDRNRVYYRYLRQIVQRGQQSGQLTDRMSVNEIVRLYALCERSLMYDWCLRGGDYSLCEYARLTMPMFLGGIAASDNK